MFLIRKKMWKRGKNSMVYRWFLSSRDAEVLGREKNITVLEIQAPVSSERDEWYLNPRNTRRFWVSESRLGVSDPRLATPKNGHFGVPFLKNSGASPNFFFDVLSGWGGQVHPQKWWEIVGEASFPFPDPEKNPSLEAKFQKFEGFFSLGGHVWGPRTLTKNFKSEFLTLLQAKNNIFLSILAVQTKFSCNLAPPS